MLSAATLTALRVTAEAAFPDTYTLTRGMTATSDGMGGQTSTATTVESGGCVLLPGAQQPDERAIADRLGYQTPYVVLVPHDSIALATDTLTVNGTLALEIGGVLGGSAWDITTRLVCNVIG